MFNTKLILILAGVLFLAGCNDYSEAVHSSHVNYFNVYPNPAHDYVNVDIQNPDKVNYVVEVFDTKGESLLKETIKPGERKEFEIMLEDKPNGSYYAFLDNGKSVTTIKFIKQ